MARTPDVAEGLDCVDTKLEQQHDQVQHKIADANLELKDADGRHAVRPRKIDYSAHCFTMNFDDGGWLLHRRNAGRFGEPR